jgi:putative endonuclease
LIFLPGLGNFFWHEIDLLELFRGGMMQNRRKQGAEGEKLAAEFLEHCGMQIVERNYRFERGEIDLIASDGDDLVFVEVKARRSSAFGPPEDAVDERKQEQIRTVAEGYLFERRIENRPCRFDVVAIEISRAGATVRHIPNAF